MLTRVIGAVVLAALALSAAACGDGSSDESATTTATTGAQPTTPAPATTAPAGTAAGVTTPKPDGTMTLHISATNTGPWKQAISLPLPDDLVPLAFYTCAVWGAPSGPCRAKPGAKLPAGTVMRLEQQPIGPAATNPDSVGWGTVGTSETAEMAAPLSNFVTGNKTGTFTYRVTLRPFAGGAPLATSNPVTITWHG